MAGGQRRRRWKRGLRDTTGELAADEAELRAGQLLWAVATYPFRFVFRAFVRGFDVS